MQIRKFVFLWLLILFHGCLSTAWIHLKTVLDCGILHYTGTLITAKLHFFTLSFNHLFLRNVGISALYYVTQHQIQLTDINIVSLQKMKNPRTILNNVKASCFVQLKHDFVEEWTKGDEDLFKN